MTALDCLSYLEEIPVCVGYEVDGKVIKDFPVTHILKDCKPVLKTLKGWHCNIRGIQNFEDLPPGGQGLCGLHRAGDRP